MNLYKRIRTAMLAVALVAGATACDDDEPEGLPRLAAPQLSVEKTSSSFTVTWPAVDNAASYAYIVGDEEQQTTAECQIERTGLTAGTRFTVKVKAVSGDAKRYSDSKWASVEVDIEQSAFKPYRQWTASNNAGPVAISDNGRYVVGSYQDNAFFLDLETEKFTEMFADFADVSDAGKAVGTSQAGFIGYYQNGEWSYLTIPSDIKGSDDEESGLLAIAPDGSFAVGYHMASSDVSTPASEKFGMMIPLYVSGESVSTLPEAAEGSLFLPYYGTYGQHIASDGTILGTCVCDAAGEVNVLWTSPTENCRPVHLIGSPEGDYPVEGFINMENEITCKGRYVYGKGEKDMDGDTWTEIYPAFYDRTTGEATFITDEDAVAEGFITCMTDDGVAFLNDTLQGTANQIYVWENGQLSKFQDWLAAGYDFPLQDEYGNDILPAAATIIGASADGRTLLGLAIDPYSPDLQFITFVINLIPKAA